MKKKRSFLLKVISLFSVLISIFVFAFIITNLEETKVKLYSSKKINLKSEYQGEIIQVEKTELKQVEIKEILDDVEEQINAESDVVKEDTLEEHECVEVELNNENCEYSINEKTNMIQIDKYNIQGDCVIIPNEINGKKVESINVDEISNSTSLETIKIPKKIATKIEKIPNFEIDESLEDEKYIIYTTTREYGSAYKAYLELTDKEKENVSFIPPKYEIPLEIREENVKLESVGAIESDSYYDLRDDIAIKVENQNPYGICYVYSAFTPAETYWSLNHGETLDFSEVHGAILTSGSGGNFLDTNSYFSSKLGPVYEEDFPIYEIRSGTFPNSSRFHNALSSDEVTSYSDLQSIAKEKRPTKYITSVKEFPTITIDYKNNSAYDSAIESVRNDIKNHIKKYGALGTLTNSNKVFNYNGMYVQCDKTTSSPDHGVTIVGWDDNFPTTNFPSSYRPNKNGAYLVLNSWGNGWGDEGYYWISYEDKWIEYWLVGVTGMTETASNLQTSSIVVTDQETGNILDNANIEDGTKVKIQLEATISNEIAGENIKVKLRDNLGDYTSYLTVSGTNFVNKKANIEMLLDTAQIKGNQYILEISYGADTVSKMIETPQDFAYIVNADGTITLNEYLGKEKEVIVPAEYDGYKVFTIGENAFNGTGVTKVTVEEGITTLGEYALANCSTLEEIYLPRTLTTIELGAFLASPKVEEIIIPRSVTTIEPGIVQYCTNLRRLIIFKETTTLGSSMFYNTPNATIYCENDSPALTFAKNNRYSYSIITESYDITYDANAGVDAVSNMPSTQNKVKYDTITMSSNVPVREGYEFLGWSVSSTATKVDYLPGDSYRNDSNLNLYAVWYREEKELSYTIEYYKDNVKQDTITERIKVSILDSDKITVNKAKINTNDKYEGYRFEKTEPEVIPDVIDNGGIIKIYYTVENYSIEYDLDGGCLEDGKNNPNSYTVNDEFTLNNPEKEGYTFIGWTGSNGNNPQKTVKIEDGTTGNKAYKANYFINTYTVMYKIDGEIYGEVESYEYGQTIVPKEDPEKDGYIFSGWSEIPEKMPAHNIEIIGTFIIDETKIKKLRYTVEYYKDGIKQDENTIIKEVQILEPDTIAVDKTKINTKDKFIGYKVEKTEPEVIPDVIDNGGVIKIYYVLENYSITYDLDGGNLEKGKTNPNSYTINDTFTLNNPEKEGHTFIGWTGSNGDEPQKIVKIEGDTGEKHYQANYTTNTYKLTIKYNHNKGDKYSKEYVGEYKYDELYSVTSPVIPGYTADLKNVNGKMGAKDISFEVNYLANTNTPYTIEYYEQNIENDEYTLFETEDDEGTTDTITTISPRNYQGFTLKDFEQQNISGDGTTNIKIYYERNKYLITYKLDGEQYGEIETYKYEQEIVPKTNPEKYGYVFSGWSEIPEKMPAQNIEITGTFTIDEAKIKKLSYRVEYYKEGVKQDIDTITKSIEVQVLEPDTINVDKTKINTKDKYVGYEVEKTEPEVIPDTIENGEIIKIYYKAKNDIKYTVEHYKQNIENDEYMLAETEECVGTTDTMTTAIEKEYRGFYSKEFDQENIAGDGSTIVKIYYDRKEAKLNIEFRDIISGKEIREKIVKTAKVYDRYDITEEIIEIEGYTLIESPNELIGEYTEEEQTKVYSYAKNSKVIVNYIDMTSKENIVESIIIDGYETKEYETELKEFENYIFVDSAGSLQGKMTKENIVVNYYYIAISQGVIEKHIDIITNEVIYSEIHEGNEGDTYKIEPKNIEGYTLIEEKLPTNAEGLMIKETIIVEYFYARNASVKVQYINKISNEIIHEETINGLEGELYTTESKEFEGYRLVEKPENAYGKMTVTKIEDDIITEILIKYYYKKISEGVFVKHYDVETNNLLGENIYSGLEGDFYKVSPREFDGYDIIEEKLPQNAEGTLTIERIEVSYYYKNNKVVTSEEYLINEDNIKKIVMGTTISDFIENMNIKENYTILDQDGNVVLEEEIIKTGMKLKLEDGKEYDLIVRGDINCDGKVSLVDLSKILLHYNGMKGFILEGCPCEAADMNFDNRVSLIDISQMLVFYNSI